MTNFKDFFKSFENLNGAKFITIKGYESKESGEIADHNILTNIKVETAKKTDLKRLQEANVEVISKESASTIAIDIFKVALSEMTDSAIKNLSANKEDRTKQSQAQTDAYYHLSNSIKLHKETGEIHIFGFHNKKYNVTKKGTYKEVKSSDKTVAKNTIRKELKLRSAKFRTFVLNNITSVNLNGKELVISCK